MQRVDRDRSAGSGLGEPRELHDRAARGADDRRLDALGGPVDLVALAGGHGDEREGDRIAYGSHGVGHAGKPTRWPPPPAFKSIDPERSKANALGMRKRFRGEVGCESCQLSGPPSRSRRDGRHQPRPRQGLQRGRRPGPRPRARRPHAASDRRGDRPRPADGLQHRASPARGRRAGRGHRAQRRRAPPARAPHQRRRRPTRSGSSSFGPTSRSASSTSPARSAGARRPRRAG